MTITNNTKKTLTAAVGMAVVILSACTDVGDSRNENVAEGDAIAKIAASHPLHDLMVTGIDPQADVLWEASATVIDEEGEHDLAPVTEEGWLLTQSAAIMLAQMGGVLQLPVYAKDKGDDWIALAKGLTQASLNAEKAVINRDKQAIIETGVVVYNVCKACHELYLEEDVQ